MIAAVRYVREALADPDLELTPTARVVLFTMASYANRQTGESFVGVTTLATIAGTSTRQVKRARAEIAASGLLPAPVSRPGRSSVWTFPTESPISSVVDHPTRRRSASTGAWCDSSCSTCHGTHYVHSTDGDFMVDCPERSSRAAS